jgi:hypothetical protein
MAIEYEKNAFKVLQGAFLQLCERAIYLETESDCAPCNPCPDYLAMLCDASESIIDANSIKDLSAINWIAGIAAMEN